MLLLQNNIIDLGKVSLGTKQTAIFEFRNTGDEALMIKVKEDAASWGALDSLELDYPRAAILPGQSARITATFRAYGYTDTKRYLQLESNMPENPGSIYLVIKTYFPPKNY